MKKVFAVALGILTAIGGFVDIGDLVTNAVVGSRFGMSLAWVVLIGVVVVLLVGVVWLVVTGADEPPTSETDGGTAGGETRGAAAPTAIELTRTPEGMQVSWAGDEEGTYVVTILSPDQPPKSLPPTGGTSVLVGNVELGDGTRCFTVAAVEDGRAGPPSDPVCPPGVSPDAVRSS